MQIAVHVLAYNVDRFIQAMLRNAAPHVDKIYVAYPSRPWGYVASSHATKLNPTPLSLIQNVGLGGKIEIIKGDWETEEAMRNDCLSRARSEGFDWLVIQDADEFYEERTWEQIRRILARDFESDHFVTTWYCFWKSSHFVLQEASGAIKGTNAGFAIRCKSDVTFSQKRLATAKTSKVIDCPCFHYGYVMSDKEMEEKVCTWGHAKDFDAIRWYRLKWKNWRESTRYLHPVGPTEWTRAIRWPYAQPDFAEEFALDFDIIGRISSRDQLEAAIFDGQALIHDAVRRFKRRVCMASSPPKHVAPKAERG